MWDIDWINGKEYSVNYSETAVAEYEQGMGDRVEYYTERFESDYADMLQGCERDDIGGLVVYANAGAVRAVYDYENFAGWVV